MSRGREERLEFDDYDDTPGKSWDDFKGRLMNYAAGRTDDRGWSLADHLMQVDEGSPGVPLPKPPLREFPNHVRGLPGL